MKKNVICKSFDDQLEEIDNDIIRFEDKLNYHEKNGEYFKKLKSSSFLATIGCVLLGIATLVIGNSLLASRDIAAFIFYAATAASGLGSFFGFCTTIYSLREIMDSKRCINEVNSQLNNVHRKRNEIVRQRNAVIRELNTSFGLKIAPTNEYETTLFNENNVITEVGRKVNRH